VLAGNVYVGECTHIGIGASVLPGIRIGKNCIVGAGAVVTKDVADGTTVVGVPAVVMNRHLHDDKVF
jgi:acetyltransferase-like isoleucine patch superfamily enzyme